MSQIPNCPECASAFSYADGELYICPECGHEWSASSTTETSTDEVLTIKDASGNLLNDGDSITVIKPIFI